MLSVYDMSEPKLTRMNRATAQRLINEGCAYVPAANKSAIFSAGVGFEMHFIHTDLQELLAQVCGVPLVHTLAQRNT